MINRIKEIQGINNLIYKGFLPFFGLLSIVVVVVFIDWTSYPTIVFCLCNPLFGGGIVLFVCFIKDYVECRQYNLEINSKISIKDFLKYHVTVYFGEPGTGKSLISFNRALMMAEKVWQDLKAEFWLLSGVVASGKVLTELEFKRWKSVEKAFHYWDTYNGIKCFGCTIKVNVDCKFNFMVTKKHLEQRRWLPEFMVILIDEIGSLFPTTESNVNNKNYRAEDKFRWVRHRNTWIVGNEQNPVNMTNFIRNVTARNVYMQGCNWIKKPYFLLTVLTKLMDYGQSHVLGNINKYKVLCFNIKKFSESLGYFSIGYKVMGNLEYGDKSIQATGVEYLHRNLFFLYDTHSHANIDLAKDMCDDNVLPTEFAMSGADEVIQETYARYKDQDNKIMEKQAKIIKQLSK